MTSFPVSRLWPWSTGDSPDIRVFYRRIILRPPQIKDWQDWSQLRALSRDFLTPWEPTWGQNDLTKAAYCDRLAGYADDWRKDRAYSFFIVRRDDGCILGALNVNNVRRGVVQSCNFGYWLGQPYAGQGYMREALLAGLKFCFHHLRLHRVEAACLLDNRASRNALLACGFHKEGLARSYLKINGCWRDHYTFSALLPDVASRLDDAQVKLSDKKSRRGRH